MAAREYPRYAIAGVSAVLLRGDRLLLVQRGSQPGQGLWALPGGAIESGEKIAEAASRELYEETGLKAEPLGVAFISNIIMRDSGKVRFHYVLLAVLFDTSTLSGELRPGGDALAVDWVKLEEIARRTDVVRSTKLIAELALKGRLTWIPIFEQ